jgi:hypothetical protein
VADKVQLEKNLAELFFSILFHLIVPLFLHTFLLLPLEVSKSHNQAAQYIIIAWYLNIGLHLSLALAATPTLSFLISYGL